MSAQKLNNSFHPKFFLQKELRRKRNQIHYFLVDSRTATVQLKASKIHRLPYKSSIITGVFFLWNEHHYWDHETLKCATKYTRILVNFSIRRASDISGQS